MLTTEQKKRLKPLRDAAVKPTVNYQQFLFVRLQENDHLGRMEKRYSDAYCYAYTQATPQIDDGELIVGKNLTPLTTAQGRERRGPTASVLSSTKWSHKEFIGGVAVNMKFSKSVLTAESCAKMMALIKTYMERAGFELQINVVERDTLIYAQKNPEEYQDLVGCIGGYSDYFVKLSPQMQAEVLLRMEHSL